MSLHIRNAIITKKELQSRRCFLKQAAKDPLNGEFDRMFMTRKLEADDFMPPLTVSRAKDSAA